MRVLIIGCGYVGTPLAAELLRLGHEVSALTRSAERAPALQAGGIQPLVADITRPEDLARPARPGPADLASPRPPE